MAEHSRRAELSGYVKNSLKYGRGELRARFINEFNEEERQQLADYYVSRCDKEGFNEDGIHISDFIRDVPEIAEYVRRSPGWHEEWNCGQYLD